MRTTIRCALPVLAFWAIVVLPQAFAAGNNSFPPEREIRQKLETAILDPGARFQENGAGISPDEAAVFQIKTLSVTVSRSTNEPLVLFCGTFSESGNRPDIEEQMSDDICGIFDLKDSSVYILSKKARQGVSIRPFPVSKTADFILLEGACGSSCEWEGLSELFEYNSSSGTFNKIWAANTYNHVSADGCDSSSEYIDRGALSEGLRGAENMREIILSITREDKGSTPPQEIKEIKELYVWKNGRPYLVQRAENARLVLDRAAGERLYAVSQINVSTTAPGRMALIDYLGDENTMVAAAADHAIFSHMYALEKAGKLDYPMIHELVLRRLDKNAPSRSRADNLLSHFRSFSGFTLTREDKDLLWNAFSGGGANDDILTLLSSAGDERVLEPLREQLEEAVKKKSACAADEAYIRINNLVSKGVPLGAKERSVLKNAAQANLICNSDDAEWNVSKNIAIWLNPAQLLPAGCAPLDTFPEVMRKMFPAREGFSGMQFLRGTSKEYCRDPIVCRTFAKSEIENLLLENLAGSGQWIDGGLESFTDEALLGIQYCRLEADHMRFIRDMEEKAILSSRYGEQKELKDFLSAMLGERCGLTQNMAHRAQAQVRISFVQDKKIIKGIGTITYGNIGAADYVINIILVPVSYTEIADTKEAVFSEISRHNSGRVWQLRKANGNVHLYNSHWGDTLLGPVCDGFWKGG